MPLTAGQLNRATLARQLLLRRERLDVATPCAACVALQAQEPASPYLALWNRLADFDPADLDAAFADRTVVKATLMRITLHAVHADDYPAFHDAMVRTLRGATPGRPPVHGDAGCPSPTPTPSSRTWSTFASPAAHEGRDRGVARGAARRQPRARARGGRCGRSRRCIHAPTGGPWSFGPRPSFVAAASPMSAGGSATSRSSGSSGATSRRFGPASAHDVAQFTLLRRAGGRARPCAAWPATLDDASRDPTAPSCYDVPGAPLPGRGHAGAAAAAADVGQHPARLRRPQPGHPAGVPPAGDPAATATCCRRCSSTATSAGVWRPVDGGIEATRVPSAVRRGVGAASRRRPVRSSPSSPTAIPPSTGATPTGGPSCRAPRFGSYRASLPVWSGRRDSNPRSRAPKARALPTTPLPAERPS